MCKKTWLTILCVLVLAAVCCCGAALADNLTFNRINGTITIPSDYVILTPNNLTAHPEWMENHYTTVEQVEDDWEERHVFSQAWTKNDDVCIEITAVADECALQYYNISAQSSETRKQYRLNHTNGTYSAGTGYTYESATWKTLENGGRWLELVYKYSDGENSWRGYQYRTVRNGYTITVDYKVIGRDVKKADLNSFRAVMKSFKFTKLVDKPATQISHCVFTSEPPAETNTGTFKVAGTTDAGVTVTAAAIHMTSSEVVTVSDVTGKTGKFSLEIKLPAEGIWLVTLVTEKDGETGEEKVFNLTTYQKNLLPVNITSMAGETTHTDKVTIAGTTLKGTSVQCIVSGAGTYDKLVNVGSKGTFSFNVPTYNEGEYTITLVFQKKDAGTRRMTYTTTREVSEEDLRARYREDAVKPAYNVLVEKIKGYTGRTLTYSMYCTSINRSGDDYVVMMAMKKKGSTYSQLVAVTCTADPGMIVGHEYRIYGTCRGTYKNADEDKYYPCIELLWKE